MGMVFSEAFVEALAAYFQQKNYFEWFDRTLAEIQNLPEYQG